MKNIDNEFFDRMDKIVSEVSDYHEKAEFVKTFFNKKLGIDDIEASMINLGRMRSKTFYYLLLSVIIEYGSMLETNEKSCQDIFSPGYIKSNNDRNEFKKKLEEHLAIKGRKLFYLFVGQIDSSKFKIDAAEEINYYRSEMKQIVGEMANDTLIIFTSREKQLIFDLLSDIIADGEGNN